MKGDDRWGKKRICNQPIIHRMKHGDPIFDSMILDGDLKGRFAVPENLTIVTCHDSPKKTLLEENLEFLGLEYVLLKETRQPFKYIYKIERMVEFLEKPRTPYVLFMDAFDTIVIDDPKKIIDIFESKGCDLLFGSTLSGVGWMCMMDKRQWCLDTITGGHYRYLNSGVYIGRWDFTLEVLREVTKYINPNSLGISDYNSTGRGQYDTRLCELLPDFPHGAPDQDILRFIHPKFYPRMQYDWTNDLVYRN